MIAFLSGTLAGKTPSAALIDVCGVGFEVGMSASSLSKLPESGAPVTVHTHLQVRDDGMALFGFLSLEEKALFEQLIGVGGVGPKIALAALSTFSPAQLAEAVADQDAARIAKVPGIGKKMAQRIILELKGTLENGAASLFGGENDGAAGREGDPEGAAAVRDALLSMGFTSAEAELALKGAPEGAGESALLQYALKKLGGALA